MLPLLLGMWLGAVSPSGVVTSTVLLEPAQRALDLVYNMQFDEALHAAQGLIDLAPAHPIGYFCRAAVYWQWRLLALDTQHRAMLLRQFHEATLRAREVAERLPAAQATEAAFYLGAVYGLQARMHVAEKQYIRALLAAKRGSNYLQQCVGRAPDWYDAYAGLGIYAYALSRAPGFLRGIVQQFIDIAGDREKGLLALEQARAHGRLSASEATSLLAKIYALPDERQYDKAYDLLEHLVQRYPNNIDYRYRLTLVSAYLGRWERARQVNRSLVVDIARDRPSHARQWLPLLHYRLAETYVLQREQLQDAIELLSALQDQDLSPALRAWVELRLGNVHDLWGEPQAAQAWYRSVQGDESAEALAHAYLTTPFTLARMELKPLEHAAM